MKVVKFIHNHVCYTEIALSYYFELDSNGHDISRQNSYLKKWLKYIIIVNLYFNENWYRNPVNKANASLTNFFSGTYPIIITDGSFPDVYSYI